MLNEFIQQIKSWKEKQDKEREERLAKLKRRVKILRYLTYRQLQNTAKRYGISTKKKKTEMSQNKEGYPEFKTIKVNITYDELIYQLSRKLYDEHFREICKRYNIKVKEGGVYE